MPHFRRPFIPSLHRFWCILKRCTSEACTEIEERTAQHYIPFEDAHELAERTTEACTGSAQIIVFLNKLIFNCSNPTCTGLNAHKSVLFQAQGQSPQYIPRTTAACKGY